MQYRVLDASLSSSYRSIDRGTGEGLIRQYLCTEVNALKTGRARLSSRILTQRKLKLGQVLRLLLMPAKNQVLCSAWPDTLGELQEEGVICVDITVSQRPIEEADVYTHCEVYYMINLTI